MGQFNCPMRTFKIRRIKISFGEDIHIVKCMLDMNHRVKKNFFLSVKAFDN